MTRALRGMDPGLLSEEITILEDTGSARDAGGGTADPTWTALATDSSEWCRVRPLSAFTRQQAQQAGSPVSHEVTMRHRTDVDTRNVLDWLDRQGTTRRLLLVSGPVNLDERDEYIVFQAREDRD